MSGDRARLRWQFGSAEDVGLAGVYAALQLRADVFVVEQQCAYADVDGRDLVVGVRHLLAWRDSTLVACARLLPPGLVFDSVAIGRVAVAFSARGQGLAHTLMSRAIEQCELAWSGADIMLGAQAHLQRFYTAHGFVPCSALYLEDGIPHIDMRRAWQGK